MITKTHTKCSHTSDPHTRYRDRCHKCPGRLSSDIGQCQRKCILLHITPQRMEITVKDISQHVSDPCFPYMWRKLTPKRISERVYKLKIRNHNLNESHAPLFCLSLRWMNECVYEWKQPKRSTVWNVIRVHSTLRYTQIRMNNCHNLHSCHINRFLTPKQKGSTNLAKNFNLRRKNRFPVVYFIKLTVSQLLWWMSKVTKHKTFLEIVSLWRKLPQENVS